MASRESMIGAQTHLSVSLSVPATPSGLQLAQLGMPPLPSVSGVGAAPPPTETKVEAQHPAPAVPLHLKPERHHSLPSVVASGTDGKVPAVPRSDSTRARDRRFDNFKTFSGRFERQLSSLRGVPQDPLADAYDVERGHCSASKISEEDTDGDGDDNDLPSADRYFTALEGAELDTLRVSTT